MYFFYWYDKPELCSHAFNQIIKMYSLRIEYSNASWAFAGSKWNTYKLSISVFGQKRRSSLYYTRQYSWLSQNLHNRQSLQKTHKTTVRKSLNTKFRVNKTIIRIFTLFIYISNSILSMQLKMALRFHTIFLCASNFHTMCFHFLLLLL